MGNGQTVALLEKRPESECPRRKECIQVDEAYVTCWDTIRSPKASRGLLSWSVERSCGLRAYPLVSPGNGSQPRLLAPCWLSPRRGQPRGKTGPRGAERRERMHPCQRSASRLRFPLLVPCGELPRSNGITLVPLNISDFRC